MELIEHFLQAASVGHFRVAKGGSGSAAWIRCYGARISRQLIEREPSLRSVIRTRRHSFACRHARRAKRPAGRQRGETYATVAAELASFRAIRAHARSPQVGVTAWDLPFKHPHRSRARNRACLNFPGIRWFATLQELLDTGLQIQLLDWVSVPSAARWTKLARSGSVLSNPLSDHEQGKDQWQRQWMPIRATPHIAPLRALHVIASSLHRVSHDGLAAPGSCSTSA